MLKKRKNGYGYLLEKQGPMLVPGLVYGSPEIIEAAGEKPLEQLKNTSCLPGIVKYAIAMPDMHPGYGFPIGGVAAFDIDTGIISPGGVGYDINCGVRLIRTHLTEKDLKGKIENIAAGLFRKVPSGTGEGGAAPVSKKDFENILKKGAKWAVDKRYGKEEDLERTENKGRMPYNPPAGPVSKRACERGITQAGSLGSGNHFLEVQVVDKIFDPETAEQLGIYSGAISVMLHTGSRGFGHQVCGDYADIFKRAAPKYSINIPDSQLVCAPVKSEEGKQYMNAMNAAANYAWANRQVISGVVQKVFEEVFRSGADKLGMEVVYDISHNIARFETHVVDGKEKKLCVHRKGATRALPPGHPGLEGLLKEIGQPVLLPGDMGRPSFVLIGSKTGKEAFYSSSHGAGRLLSRKAALKKGKGRDIISELRAENIIVTAKNRRLLAEEASYAYKNAADVADVVEKAGLAKKVAKLKPLAVIKG